MGCASLLGYRLLDASKCEMRRESLVYTLHSKFTGFLIHEVWWAWGFASLRPALQVWGLGSEVGLVCARWSHSRQQRAV